MTSKEKAELLFKQEQLSGGQSSVPEYEQRALAERKKTARLRELRLARKAELKSPKDFAAARGHSLTRRILKAGG